MSESTGQRYCPSCGHSTNEPHCPRDGVATVVRSTIQADALTVRTGDLVGDRYRILGLLGRGGFGAVYSAAHTGTQQHVALKMMLAGDVGDDEVRRFYREAQITAGLRHPNTVRVFDVGQTPEGALYIAMELLNGPSLEERLKKERVLTQQETSRIAVAVLRSLGEAHSKGLVHRDLKPANVMLSRIESDEDDDTTVVKVLDFGIARPPESSLTGQGTALGTPSYMSPEQCAGTELDGRSDLYSLGVMLYRCVCGRPPFADRNPMTLMFKHVQAPPPPLADAALVEVTAEFVHVVQRALAKDPADRFASAAEMRKAIQEAAARAPRASTARYAEESAAAVQAAGIDAASEATIASVPTETHGATTVDGTTQRGPRPELALAAAEGEATVMATPATAGVGGVEVVLEPAAPIYSAASPDNGSSQGRLWLGGAILLLLGGAGALAWSVNRQPAAKPPPPQAVHDRVSTQPDVGEASPAEDAASTAPHDAGKSQGAAIVVEDAGVTVDAAALDTVHAVDSKQAADVGLLDVPLDGDTGTSSRVDATPAKAPTFRRARPPRRAPKPRPAAEKPTPKPPAQKFFLD